LLAAVGLTPLKYCREVPAASNVSEKYVASFFKYQLFLRNVVSFSSDGE